MVRCLALLPVMFGCAMGMDLAITQSSINARRGQQGASNMNKLTYNKAHERAATTWGTTCKEAKPADNSFANFDAAFFFVELAALGNILGAFSDILTLAYVTNKASYTISSNTCAAGKDEDCRRYKTMSYSGYKSYACALATGCATKITKLDGNVIFGKVLVICVLQPKMPDPSTRPFIPGTPCTNCAPGYAKCETLFCTLGDGPTTTTSVAPTNNVTATGNAAPTNNAAPTANTSTPGKSPDGSRNVAPAADLSALLLTLTTALQLCGVQRC